MKQQIFLTNAFSLGMLKAGAGALVEFKPVALSLVREILSKEIWTSAVGHADTAAKLTRLLGVQVRENRVNIALAPGVTIFVAQYDGGRLQEGTRVLPEGSEFVFWVCEIVTPF